MESVAAVFAGMFMGASDLGYRPTLMHFCRLGVPAKMDVASMKKHIDDAIITGGKIIVPTLSKFADLSPKGVEGLIEYYRALGASDEEIDRMLP